MGTSVAERIIAEVFAALPVNTNTAVGRRATGEHGAPPRVVAIPLGSSQIVMTDKPGQQTFVDPDTNQTVSARAILTRQFAIQWECHGAPPTDVIDFGPAERLFLATLKAIRKACHHSVEFSAEEWHDQQEGNDGFIKHGTLIKFTTTIAIPVFDELYTIVHLTANPQIVTTAKLNDETEGA